MKANLTTLLTRSSDGSITENIIGLPGRLTYDIASTDLGKKSLAVGAGIYALRTVLKKKQEKEEDTQQETQPKPQVSTTPQWLKQGRVKYA